MSILPRPKPFGKALKRMEDSQRRTAKNVENQDEVQALTGTFIRKTFESVDPEQVFKSSEAIILKTLCLLAYVSISAALFMHTIHVLEHGFE